MIRVGTALFGRAFFLAALLAAPPALAEPADQAAPLGDPRTMKFDPVTITVPEV